MALLDRENELLKRKSTALELKRLQRQQGGIGGAGGNAVDGNLANNNIYNRQAPSTLTAPTTPTGALNATQLGAISQEETAALQAPVQRPATEPLPTAATSLGEVTKNREFLDAVLQERRNLANPEQNVQGAFDVQGNRIGSTGQGTFSVVGQDAETAAANNAFLEDYRAKQAERIRGVRQAEQLGEAKRGADKRRDAQREAIESKLFQAGIGRYRANRKEDNKILAALAPFLSGESEAISDDLAAELGLISNREQAGAATEQARLGAQARLSETQRQSVADQFAQQQRQAEAAASQAQQLFDNQLALREAGAEEAKLGADVKQKEQDFNLKAERLKLDKANLERSTAKDRVKKRQDILSFISDNAITNKAQMPTFVENVIDEMGDTKEEREQFLAGLITSKVITEDAGDAIAKKKGFLQETK